MKASRQWSVYKFLVFAQKLSSRNTSNNNDNTSNINDTIVTLQQQHRAVSCLFSLCKDETIESPKQDVHSDKGLNIKLLTSNAQDGRPIHDVDP